MKVLTISKFLSVGIYLTAAMSLEMLASGPRYLKRPVYHSAYGASQRASAQSIFSTKINASFKSYDSAYGINAQSWGLTDPLSALAFFMEDIEALVKNKKVYGESIIEEYMNQLRDGLNQIQATLYQNVRCAKEYIFNLQRQVSSRPSGSLVKRIQSALGTTSALCKKPSYTQSQWSQMNMRTSRSLTRTYPLYALTGITDPTPYVIDFKNKVSQAAQIVIGAQEQFKRGLFNKKKVLDECARAIALIKNAEKSVNIIVNTLKDTINKLRIF